jgi:arginine N-succinyltransferase
LQDENFECCDMVDIFEAGPVVRCNLADIRTVRQSRRTTVAATADTVEGEPVLISNGKDAYRATIAPVAEHPAGATIPAAVAAALNVKPGDPIRHVPLKRRPEQRYQDANVSFD